MRRWRGLALACALGAVGSLARGAIQGELQVALFLVFPVVYGSGLWGILGIGLLMAAFLAFFLDAASSLGEVGARPEEAWDRGSDPVQARRRDEGDPWDENGDEAGDGRWLRAGGVIMLGPIPIVLGSDKRTTMVLMGLAVLLMAMGLAWWVLVAR